MIGEGKQIAQYNETFGAPFCEFVGTECSSIDLLNGRGAMEGGNEPNRSNTIDGCTDGNYGVYHEDESIDKIVVRSGGVDGSGSGGILEAGENATIAATVYGGEFDYVDFYYSVSLFEPDWQYIGTAEVLDKGIQEIEMEYTMPRGDPQVVRVNLRHGGKTSKCPAGGFDESDDIVFSVINPSDPPS